MGEAICGKSTGGAEGAAGEADAGTEASSSIKAGDMETVLEDGPSSEG